MASRAAGREQHVEKTGSRRQELGMRSRDGGTHRIGRPVGQADADAVVCEATQERVDAAKMIDRQKQNGTPSRPFLVELTKHALKVVQDSLGLSARARRKDHETRMLGLSKLIDEVILGKFVSRCNGR